LFYPRKGPPPQRVDDFDSTRFAPAGPIDEPGLDEGPADVSPAFIGRTADRRQDVGRRDRARLVHPPKALHGLFCCRLAALARPFDAAILTTIRTTRDVDISIRGIGGKTDPTPFPL
jgi:hypothetical protein